MTCLITIATKDSGPSTFKETKTTFTSFPSTNTTSTISTTTTTLNGKDNTPKPFLFNSTTAPSSLTSTSNKAALKRELSDLNKNFIDKLHGAMDKESSVNLAQVFNKYTESRLKIKKSHSGSSAKDTSEPKKFLFSSTTTSSSLFSTKPVVFGGFGATSDKPVELFTGRKLSVDKSVGLFTGRKQSEDDNDDDEYNRQSEEWEAQQEFEGHYNGGEEDEYEEVDENDENDYIQDDEEERDHDEAEEAEEEEPKPKSIGGFNFGVTEAAKPKPAAFNFGVTFPSSTTTSSTTTITTTTATSGFGGAFSSGGFGGSTGGAFGGFSSKGSSDSAPKTSTPGWSFGQVTTSGATSQSTSAPTSTPSLFSTPSNPFSSASSSITPAPFAPAKPFSFNVPGASTAATTTPAPFSGFQVPKATVASSNEAESDKMPDETKSELQGDREGEEDEKTVFEVKAKLYAIEGGENKDKGVGQFRVNENGETKKRRMIMRSTGLGQLMLNSKFFFLFSVGWEEEKTQVLLSCF